MLNGLSARRSYSNLSSCIRGSRLTWHHPEAWAMLASFAAWLMLATEHLAGGGHSLGIVVGSDHLTPLWSAGNRWLQQLTNGAIMLVAMMPPLVIPQIRVTALRSLWVRRHRAVAGFLLGYLGVWLIVIAAAALLSAVLAGQSWAPTPLVAAVAFLAAGVWQLTAIKSVGLRGCHRTIPLAPTGWRADRDCARYGFVTGRSCLLSCWAIMLACMLAEHDLLTMVCASGVVLAERFVFRPNQRVLATVLIYVGGLYWLGLV
jgi:predicted metal-binding membrane protein